MRPFCAVAALYGELGGGRVEGEEVLLMGSGQLGSAVELFERAVTDKEEGVEGSGEDVVYCRAIAGSAEALETSEGEQLTR